MADLRDINALTLSAAAASADGADIETGGAQGVILFVDVTAISGTSPAVTFTVQGKTAQGAYYDILSSSSITAPGKAVLRVHPSLAPAANAKEADLLPDIIRVTAAVSGTGPSVSATVKGELVD